LLGDPVVEQVAREADVPPYSMARQATSPHDLIDPAGPSAQQNSYMVLTPYLGAERAMQIARAPATV
jgi:hypothetical protein